MLLMMLNQWRMRYWQRLDMWLSMCRSMRMLDQVCIDKGKRMMARVRF